VDFTLYRLQRYPSDKKSRRSSNITASSTKNENVSDRPRRKRWIDEILDEELKKELKAHFGSVKRGLKELLEAYKRALGPRDPEVFRIWDTLVKLQEQEPDKCIELPKVFEVLRQMGYDTRVFYKLLEEGYIKHCGPNKIVVVNAKDLTTLFLPF